MYFKKSYVQTVSQTQIKKKKYGFFFFGGGVPLKLAVKQFAQDSYQPTCLKWHSQELNLANTIWFQTHGFDSIMCFFIWCYFYQELPTSFQRPQDP